jgi:acyl-CoA thioesterase-1
MNENKEWAFYKRVGALAALVAFVACGADGNANDSRNSRVTKDNTTATTGRADSAPVSVRKPVVAGAPDVSRDAVQTRTPVVLFFGTSLTAGYGLDPSQAFPALIEKKARDEGVPIKVVNAGLSGETTAGAVRRIDWVLRTPADLVVIEGGANDALRGLSPDAARANLERLIAAVREKQPRARIALIQMEAPPNYGRAYTQSFRSIYSDVAKKQNIPLLPFLLEGVAGITRLNQADGVHPNLSGERIVAENVWRGLKPIITQLDRGLQRG